MKKGLYHITCVVNGLVPVFSRPEPVLAICDCWQRLRVDSGMRLYAYVIMEEHLHFLAETDNLHQSLDIFMAESARRILEHLRKPEMERYLRLLTLGGEAELWQRPPETGELDTGARVLEIMDYIHINPVKRGYVDLPEQWRYSSARDYKGTGSIFEPDRWPEYT